MRIFFILMLFLFTLSFSATHVFWYKAKTNNFDLTLCTGSGKGPCLPSDAIVHEGTIATGSVAQHTGNSSHGFFLGNGASGSHGYCSFFWSKDLNHASGNVTSARFGAEYWDGFHDLCVTGPISMRFGVADFSENIDHYCGGIVQAEEFFWANGEECVSDTATWHGFLNPLGSSMGFDMSTPQLAASDFMTIQAPSGQGDCWDRGRPDTCHSLLDSQFVSIDVTNQVNWILSHDGQYAIVFLVEPGTQAGGTGKIAAYAWENAPGFEKMGMASDNPWSRDGNSAHLVVESNDLQVVGIDAPKGVKVVSNCNLQAFPNPFKSVTVLSYTLKAGGRIDIYDISGGAVKRFDVSGTGRVEWDAGKCAPGVYVARLMSGGNTLKTRMLVVSR